MTSNLEFGELRSAVGRARRDPQRIDVVVWAVLTAHAPQREVWSGYAVASLAGYGPGFVDLGELVAWMDGGYDALCQRVKDHYEVTGDTIALFCAGLAWAIVKRPEKAPFAVLGGSPAAGEIQSAQRLEGVLRGYTSEPTPAYATWRLPGVELWAMEAPSLLPETDVFVVHDVEVYVGSQGWAGLDSLYDERSPVSASIRMRVEQLERT